MDDKVSLFNKPSCQQVIDILPNPFVIIGKDYRIMAANRQYLRKYNVRAEDVVGSFCYKVSHHSDQPCSCHGEHCPLDEVISTGRTTHVIHFHYDKEGKEEQVQLQTTPIYDDEGNVVSVGEYINVISSQDEDELLGRSRSMMRLTSILQRVAPTQTTVLLQGESGVGKECVAEYLHLHSNRASGPFIVVDSTTLGENLIESELFGHEKGAFTGANGRKQGLIEAADGGTLFIDEIGELPLSLQTKLLRLLESNTIRPVGATSFREVDIRVIAATHRNLQEMVGENQFRQDLYFRLSAFPVDIPPLRERKNDIRELAEYFLSQIENGQQHIPLETDVLEVLFDYDYPGNVRELRNIIERAAILAADEKMHAEHLSFLQCSDTGLQPSSSIHNAENPNRFITRRRNAVNDHEILHTLEKYKGHRAETARELGMSERTLYRHLRRIRA